MTATASPAFTAPSEPAPSRRALRFERRAYGLFLHWGLYSLGARGEWELHYHRPPPANYARRLARFDAAGWDAPALAAWAMSAGFRYVCLTTRHHDGFSLYDTRGLNRYDAPHSAARRDLVAEFATAVRAAGLGVFFYHTTLDWWHPDFDRDFPAYLRYLRASVEILCRHYGRIDGFWFDGNWARRDRDWEEDALYGLIRRHQPQAILVNNSSTGARGQIGHRELDAITFEQGTPRRPDRTGAPKYLVPEMCDTANSHWGTATRDFSFKSPGQVIETLAACRRCGANLLFNVGPLADGSLPPYERALLDTVGRWIDTCGTSLYAGRPTDLACSGRDFVLHDGHAWFYYAHALPIRGNTHLAGPEARAGWRTVAGPLPVIRCVQWVDDAQPLRFTQDSAAGLLAFDATAHPYGTQHVVRVARMTPAD